MYEKHCNNLRVLKRAVKVIQLNLRSYISQDDEGSSLIFTNVLSHLVTCLSENRILKIVYEPNAFTQQERDLILEVRDLKGRWLTAVNIAICKANDLTLTQNVSEISERLRFTQRAKYREIVRLINEELLDAAEVRNCVAHGQWVYAFTSDLRTFSQDLTRKVRSQNIVKLQLRMKIFESLGEIIHDLAVSPQTYERDFDAHFRKVEEQTRNLHNRTYNTYKQRLIAKYNRGLEKRRSSSAN